MKEENFMIYNFDYLPKEKLNINELFLVDKNSARIH